MDSKTDAPPKVPVPESEALLLEREAQVAFEAGDYVKTLRLTNELLGNDLQAGDRAHLLCQRAEVLFLTGEESAACKDLKDCLELLDGMPGEASILFNRGKAYYYLFEVSGDPNCAEQALRSLNEVVEKYQASSYAFAAFALIGSIGLSTGRLDDAAKAYRSALGSASQERERINARMGLAAALFRAGSVDEAESICRSLVQEGPPIDLLSRVHFILGDIASASGRSLDALAHWDVALARQPADPTLRDDTEHTADLLSRLARVAFDLGRYDVARAYSEKLLALVDEEHIYYCDAHILLGHLAYATDTADQALEHYEKVLAAPGPTEEQREVVLAAIAGLRARFQ